MSQAPTTQDICEIRVVLDRYALACDEHDFESLRDCFTTDAVAEYSGRRLEPGVDRIIEYVSPLAALAASQHVVGTVRVVPHTAGAAVTSYTVARLVRAVETGHQIAHRGLRYDDVFVRTDDGWRIRHRVHNPLWATTEATEWPPMGHTQR